MKCGLAGSPVETRPGAGALKGAHRCLFVKKGPEGGTQTIQHTWKDRTRGLGKWQKMAGQGQSEGYPSGAPPGLGTALEPWTKPWDPQSPGQMELQFPFLSPPLLVPMAPDGLQSPGQAWPAFTF